MKDQRMCGKNYKKNQKIKRPLIVKKFLENESKKNPTDKKYTDKKPPPKPSKLY